MRLRELEDILVQSQPGLGQLKQNSQPTGLIQFSGIVSVRRSMEMLSQIASLKSIIAAARATAIFQAVGDVVLLQQDAAQLIVSVTQQVTVTVSSLISAIRMIGIPDESPLSVSIKLPPASTVDELISVLKVFQQGIDRPIIDLTGNGTQLAGFDRGSFWIELTVGSAIGFRIITKLLDVIKKYRIDRMEVDYANEILRSKKIQNNHLAAVQSATQSQLDILAQSYAKEVVDDYFSGQAEKEEKHQAQLNETRVAIANSIKEFDRLIDKGLEIHPALHAPSDIRQLFPVPLTSATITPAQLPAQAESSAKPDVG